MTPIMGNDNAIKSGEVESFDMRTGRGTVTFDGGGDVEFGKSSFDSGAPFRFARPGDRVDVITNDQNRVLRVRRRD